MLIQGIKRGRTIELLEDIDIADGETVTVEVRDRSVSAGESRTPARVSPTDGLRQSVGVACPQDLANSVSVGESQPKPRNFWEAMLKWREEYAVEELDIDPDEIWGDVRDRSPGHEFSWDE